MKNLVPFVIGLVVVVFFINYINVSNQVKQSAIKSEVVVVNSLESFMDIVTDKGAVTSKDINVLFSELIATGGAYDLTMTVERLQPVPVEGQAGAYIMEYQPAYGWSSNQGLLRDTYQDRNWATGQANAPKGVQYLLKGDSFTVTLKQTDAMNYQRSIVTRLGMGVQLGKWDRSGVVRNTGSNMIQP